MMHALLPEHAFPEATVCLNGALVPSREASVSVWDRGFIFGDAIYEVWRLYRGRLWGNERHYSRLVRSLREVSIEHPDLAGLNERIERTVRESGVDEGMVYLQITRGVAPRKHAFPDPPARPTELIAVLRYDDGPTARAREAGAAVISHPDIRWGRCDIKSTNLLANVLANEAAHKAGVAEAVLIDGAGQVTEATHSSLLWVREGTLAGSPETNEILPGTTRGAVLELARDLRIPFREERIDLPTLMACEEVMLAGTTIEVLPVVKVDDTTIQGGKCGPIARALQAEFRRRVESWLADGPARAHSA